MDGFAFPIIISGQQRLRSALRPPYARPASRMVHLPLDPLPSPPSHCRPRYQNNHRFEQSGTTACNQMCIDGAVSRRFMRYCAGGRHEESKSRRQDVLGVGDALPVKS
jgi:hypothetical protein